MKNSADRIYMEKFPSPRYGPETFENFLRSDLRGGGVWGVWPKNFRSPTCGPKNFEIFLRSNLHHLP